MKLSPARRVLLLIAIALVLVQLNFSWGKHEVSINGLVEAVDERGQEFGEARLLRLIQSVPAGRRHDARVRDEGSEWVRRPR